MAESENGPAADPAIPASIIIQQFLSIYWRATHIGLY
jgi:hypothetical protein